MIKISDTTSLLLSCARSRNTSSGISWLPYFLTALQPSQTRPERTDLIIFPSLFPVTLFKVSFNGRIPWSYWLGSSSTDGVNTWISTERNPPLWKRAGDRVSGGRDRRPLEELE
ncbi:hypothetical protein R1flu_005704 [Riccia fluitans]|uniref:Uncharacterized protein n=1 Tax=Riccia fluitans TaxID=41844 RepID=A0ABD1YUR2_9MARC